MDSMHADCRRSHLYKFPACHDNIVPLRRVRNIQRLDVGHLEGVSHHVALRFMWSTARAERLLGLHFIWVW